MSSPPPSCAAPPAPVAAQPPRKFPAPCWTHDETLSLITAYKDKWYSLRRRNLRSPDWDAVAATVNTQCPNQNPPKTSAQCRHKMEKLRKRYRAEKQRFCSVPHRFFSSSWVFFDLMDAMETGGSPNETRIVKVDLGSEGLNGGSSLKGHLGKFVGDGLSVSNGSGSGNHGNLRETQMRFTPKNSGSPLDFEDDDEEDLPTRFKPPSYGGGSGGGGGYEFKGCQWKSGGGSGSGGGGVGGKRAAEMAEMAEAIRMMGEGYVKMEKMKLEMGKEIERMRMEMEMKRSQMIVESQQLIISAVVEAFLDFNNSNKKFKSSS